jgi:hypothetical protein
MVKHGAPLEYVDESIRLLHRGKKRRADAMSDAEVLRHGASRVSAFRATRCESSLTRASYQEPCRKPCPYPNGFRSTYSGPGNDSDTSSGTQLDYPIIAPLYTNLVSHHFRYTICERMGASANTKPV